jgi:hypothetical protein
MSALSYASSYITESTFGSKKARINLIPIEDYIGKDETFASYRLSEAEKTTDIYESSEDLYLREWRHLPASEEYDIEMKEGQYIKTFVRTKKGHTTYVTRSYGVDSKGYIKSLYQLKIAGFTEEYGVPKCLGSGRSEFGPMDMSRIYELGYIMDCQPQWTFENRDGFEVGIDLDYYTSNPSNPYNKHIKDVEKIVVTAIIDEENEYLTYKNN